MMVANAGSPSTQANLRKAQLESWDYAVELIDDGDSQSDYDSEGPKSIACYIPDEVSSSHIDKVTDFTVGVVCEDEDGDDDLGFSSANGVDYTGNRIDVIDNSHYITSPFSTGQLTVFTVAHQALSYLNGTAAGGLQILAERAGPSNDVHFILETGAALYPSGTATGRRVRMPWRDYDFNRLTADGLTLLQRSIEWAAQPNAKAKGRRVQLPWGGFDFDVDLLNADHIHLVAMPVRIPYELDAGLLEQIAAHPKLELIDLRERIGARNANLEHFYKDYIHVNADGAALLSADLFDALKLGTSCAAS